MHIPEDRLLEIVCRQSVLSTEESHHLQDCETCIDRVRDAVRLNLSGRDKDNPGRSE
jgi:hypothetical protein